MVDTSGGALPTNFSTLK